jgi:hypothetical protein
MHTITVGQPRIEKASHRPNLQFDIFPAVTFVTALFRRHRLRSWGLREALGHFTGDG